MKNIFSRLSLRTFSAVGFILVGFCAPVAIAAPQEQTITWVAPAAAFIPLHEPTPLLATASSGLPVTFEVEHGPAVIVDGQLAANSPGAIWIKRNKPAMRHTLPLRQTECLICGRPP